MPPAALVSATTVQPAATAVRTPCTVALTGSPSYRCVRPTKTSTRRLPAASDRTVPACPGTVGRAKPPRLLTGISVTSAPRAAANASAAGAHPEPSTTAASCRGCPVSSASRRALRAAAWYGSAPPAK